MIDQNSGNGVVPYLPLNELNKNIEVTHLHLNDDTIAGIRLKNKNCFSVQFHPEASAGPHDSSYLFDEFVQMINK